MPVVFLLGGVVLVGWGVRRRRALARAPRDWVHVMGTVIEVGGSHRVEYVSRGRRLRLQAPAGMPMVAGSQVAVLVDPHDPTRARLADLERDAERLVRTLIALGVVSLVLGVITVVVFA